MFHIKIDEKGRGLYSDNFIPMGTVLGRYELLVLNEQDTIQVNKTDLQYYTFKYDNSRDCLVLGYGEIFNHSDSPNVSFRLIEHENRKLMEFITIKDVFVNEELLINYNEDIETNINMYQTNKSLY